jgi:hypothetical protein
MPQKPAEVFVAKKVETLQTWHERLGHQNKQYIEKYLRKKQHRLCEGRCNV